MKIIKNIGLFLVTVLAIVLGVVPILIGYLSHQVYKLWRDDSGLAFFMSYWAVAFVILAHAVVTWRTENMAIVGAMVWASWVVHKAENNRSRKKKHV